MERYITAGRIALHARTNARTTLSRLHDAGVLPVVSSDVQKGVSSVWRLSDVEFVFSQAILCKHETIRGLQKLQP